MLHDLFSPHNTEEFLTLTASGVTVALILYCASVVSRKTLAAYEKAKDARWQPQKTLVRSLPLILINIVVIAAFLVSACMGGAIVWGAVRHFRLASLLLLPVGMAMTGSALWIASEQYRDMRTALKKRLK